MWLCMRIPDQNEITWLHAAYFKTRLCSLWSIWSMSNNGCHIEKRVLKVENYKNTVMMKSLVDFYFKSIRRKKNHKNLIIFMFTQSEQSTRVHRNTHTHEYHNNEIHLCDPVSVWKRLSCVIVIRMKFNQREYWLLPAYQLIQNNRVIILLL